MEKEDLKEGNRGSILAGSRFQTEQIGKAKH